jgi:hypothetical protein
MFHNILDGYIMDTKSLYAKYKLEEGEVNEEEISEEEDDLELWSSETVSKAPKFSGADAEQSIRGILDTW